MINSTECMEIMAQKRATSLKLLLVSDLNGQIRRVTSLCEHIVCSVDSDLDAVLVCGGFVAGREPSAYARNETIAAAEGDMMALISRLEAIVCRVLYVPGENDPLTTRPTWEEFTPNLTQYSVNCFAKTETLVAGVGVTGDENYMRLIGESQDPTVDLDLLLVLRDATATNALPTASTTEFDSRHIEIVGGAHPKAAATDRVVYPGSLRLGQFTILELNRNNIDDSWHIQSCRLQRLPASDDDDDELET